MSTTVARRGLQVRLLTDKLFFDSGSAVVNAAALPTLDKIGGIIADGGEAPRQRSRATPTTGPIATSQFPSNWQLSGARAGAVVQRLIGAGVGGSACRSPATPPSIRSRATRRAAGRARNRRVEIVLTRLHGATPSHGGDTP